MELQFTSDNGISVTACDTDGEVHDEHTLEFCTDPTELAGRLRALADFIEAHRSYRMVAEID